MFLIDTFFPAVYNMVSKSKCTIVSSTVSGLSMKNIYIILTQSTSLPSRLIRFFTGETYTHASIAFDSDIHAMYSFARKYASLPFPAGLVEEHIDSGFYRTQGHIPCTVLRIPVSEREYYDVKNQLYNMFCRSEEYKYSIIGLLFCKFHLPIEIPGYFFCSQFVAKLLHDCGITELPKHPALMHPADFLDMDSFEVVFEGRLSELNEIRTTPIWAFYGVTA